MARWGFRYLGVLVAAAVVACGCRSGGQGSVAPAPVSVVAAAAYAESDSAASGGPLAVHWRYTHSADLRDIAVRPDGTILVGTGDSLLLAFSPTGDLLWSTDTGNTTVGPPAIATDGTAYVGTADGYLVAIGPDGEILWRVLSLGTVSGPPVIGPDGAVYFGSTDGSLRAVDGAGRVLRTCALPVPRLPGVGSPSFGPDGTLYVGGGGLHALDGDGTVLWSEPRATPFAEILIDEAGTCYFLEDCPLASSGPVVGVWFASRGREPVQIERSVYAPCGPLQRSPSGAIYLAARRAVHVLVPGDPPALREVPGATDVASALLFRAGGEVRYVGRDGSLRGFREDGAPIEPILLSALPPTTSLPWGPRMSLAAGPGGTVYVACRDGLLIALDPGPAPTSPPALGPLRSAIRPPERVAIGPLLHRAEAGDALGQGDVRGLARRGDWAKPVIPTLLARLAGASDADEREELLRCLAGLSGVDPDAARAVIDAIGDEKMDRFARARVIEAVGEAEPRDPEVTRVLLERLDGEPPRDAAGQTVERAVMLALVRRAPQEVAPRLVPIAFARGPGAVTGSRPHNARTALEELGAGAVAPLEDFVASGESPEHDRGEACRLLGRIGKPALGALGRLLGSDDPATRRAAVEGLRAVRSQGALALIRERLEVEQDARVREELARAAAWLEQMTGAAAPPGA